LVLDEPRENDENYEVEGISFVMAEPVVSSMQVHRSVVAIDYVEDARGKGFRLFLKEGQRAVSSEQ
jgi:hypothetical protein